MGPKVFWFDYPRSPFPCWKSPSTNWFCPVRLSPTFLLTWILSLLNKRPNSSRSYSFNEVEKHKISPPFWSIRWREVSQQTSSYSIIWTFSTLYTFSVGWRPDGTDDVMWLLTYIPSSLHLLSWRVNDPDPLTFFSLFIETSLLLFQTKIPFVLQNTNSVYILLTHLCRMSVVQPLFFFPDPILILLLSWPFKKTLFSFVIRTRAIDPPHPTSPHPLISPISFSFVFFLIVSLSYCYYYIIMRKEIPSF